MNGFILTDSLQWDNAPHYSPTCPRWREERKECFRGSFPPVAPRPLFPRLSPGLLAATSSAGRASLFLSAANWSALGVGPHHTSYSLADVNSAMEVICQSLGHVHTVLKYRGRPDATCFGFSPLLVDISDTAAVQVFSKFISCWDGQINYHHLMQ